MDSSLLKIEDLSVKYKLDKETIDAVRDVNIVLNRGDSLGIIGESGSGKTSLAMAIMGLIESPSDIRGHIYYEGKDMNRLSKDKLNSIRWNNISIVFQNSLDVLNPLLTIQEQIYEVIYKHLNISEKEGYKRVVDLMDMVGLDRQWRKYYPHQLSGGMRQRALIAMALACNPDLLIVDEPTTALDAVSKRDIRNLISRLHKEQGFALIVISHEIETISELTSRTNVMYSGCIIEKGITSEIIKDPMHTYTRGLLNASPSINPYRDMWGIPGKSGALRKLGCPFYERCTQKLELCETKKPELHYVSVERQVACNRGGIVTLLEGKGVEKSYKFKGEIIRACNKCSMKIRWGEVVALIGESGSGKTTLASILAGILPWDDGELLFEGTKVSKHNVTSRKEGVQIVFQDPFSAINDRFTIKEAIMEPLNIIKDGSHEYREEKAKNALQDVQLPFDESFLSRKCHMLSGGQRQRVALARALVMEPRLLIADEISSMLDPSTQANILRLLKGLQNKKGFAMLYITHDLFIARKIADIVYVMNKGKIVEYGLASDIFSNPVNSYTKKLVKEGIGIYE
ncbi:ABC transporter ATP-binding protein [Clostridiisalibacter paucivorans]|uniref:ABC transporter ATP-binding protein n=1 Tax=Clostridiisalibacter paucivorans TaxID=408753 RepID=UPI00047B36F6|nr:ABC transporter ATP-binding protein [Clostridiisalibacter paucivorans]